jgi:hypothetical protein
MNEIIKELKILNKNIAGILIALEGTKKTKFEQVVDITCAGVGILGILTIVDIIIKWIIGG